MLFYTLTTKSGKEFKLRLKGSGQIEFRKEIGKGIMDGYKDIPNDPAGFIIPLLWQSAQTFEHKFTKIMATDLFDELVEDGYVITDFMTLATEILGVSGFFGQETVASIRDEMATAKI